MMGALSIAFCNPIMAMEKEKAPAKALKSRQADLEVFLLNANTAAEFKAAAEEAHRARSEFKQPIADLKVGLNEFTLILAACYNHLPALKQLILEKTNIHASDDLALMLAAREGNIFIIKALLAAGMTPAAKDRATLEAVERRQFDCAALLILSKDLASFKKFHFAMANCGPCEENFFHANQLIAEHLRSALIEALYYAAQEGLAAYKRAAANFYLHRCLFNSYVCANFERSCVASSVENFAYVLATTYGHTAMLKELGDSGKKCDTKPFEVPLLLEKMRALIRFGSEFGDPEHQYNIEDRYNIDQVMETLASVLAHDPKNVEFKKRVLTTVLLMAIKFDRHELARVLICGPEKDFWVDLHNIEGFYGNYENGDATNKDKFYGLLAWTPYDFAQHRHANWSCHIMELIRAVYCCPLNACY